MVVGILTTLRHPPTVLDVARRLVHVTNAMDMKLLAWQSYSASRDVGTRLNLEQLGFSVAAQHAPYPELEPNRIRVTWNDSLDRMKWRTNHGEGGTYSINGHCVSFTCIYLWYYRHAKAGALSVMAFAYSIFQRFRLHATEMHVHSFIDGYRSNLVCMVKYPHTCMNESAHVRVHDQLQDGYGNLDLHCLLV